MRRGILVAALLAMAPAAGAFNWYAGQGTDGDLGLSGARTEDSVKTGINGVVSVGAVSIPVGSGGSFASGNLVLLIQMYGTGAGQYEFSRVLSTAAASLTLSRGTLYAYQATGAQVVKVNEYGTVTLNAGASWTASAWNGTSGGVLAAVVRGSFTMTGGLMAMNGNGFRGSSSDPLGENGAAGEGPGGGGGGQGNNPSNTQAAGGGGGGGFGSAGTTGQSISWPGGAGGGVYGSVALATMTFGSGGGQGTRNGTGITGTVGAGGNGGGVVLLVVAGDVGLLGGVISSDGSNGGDSSGNTLYSSGGGGAGGAIRIVSSGTVSMGAGNVHAAAGGGGTFGTDGGVGGMGRIALLQVSTISGTTSPAFDASSPDGVTLVDPYSLPPSNPMYTAASSASLSLSWTLTYPASQSPVVVISTRADFGVILTSGTGTLGQQTTTWAVPFDNSTYYFKVKALGDPDSNFTAAVSTLNAVATPTDIFFDEISTRSITASAYAPLTGFSSMAAGLSGTNISLGGNYQGWHGERWTSKTAMTTIRGFVAAGVVGGKVYALGGVETVPLATNEEYDPVVNGWTGKTAMPTARYGLAAGVVGGKIYAIGGANGGSRTENEEFDPVGNSWSVKAAMPTAREGLAVGAAGDRVYAVGGANPSPVAVNEEYDPATNTWATRAPLPAPRTSLTIGVAGGKVYALGGQNGPDSALNEQYDPGSNTWTAKSSMRTARQYPAAAVLGGKLYVLGGQGGNGGTNEEYDFAGNTWTTRAPMPTGRYTLAVAAMGGRVYALGGNNGGSYLNTNEQYDPGTASSFTALTPNTLYAFRAKARNSAGSETGESPVVSTYTLAFATMPQVGTPLFPGAFLSSITVNWSSGTDSGGYNGSGASYLVQASTMATFVPVAGSSQTRNLFATVEGLTFPNATHYFRIRAYNAANVTDYSWYVLGSTSTAIEAPTAIYFDEVSSRSITASAYAPGPAFSSMTAGLSGTNIALGGNYQGWHGERWTARAAMTTARDGLAAAAIGGKLYAVGGHASGVRLAQNEEFDPVTNAWTGKASMPTARNELAAAVAGGKIYAVGGFNGTISVNALEEYDPATNSWVARAAMPTARYGLAAVAVSGKVYAMGGNNGSNLGRNEEYDPVDNSWAALADMPTARYGLAAGVVEGKVYAVGGDAAGVLAVNERYDRAANSWVAMAAMPTARRHLAASVVAGKVYAVGGLDGPALSKNEEYDPGANSWVGRSAMPSVRNHLAVAVISGRIYAVGGFSGSVLGTNEAYDPGTASSFTALTPNTAYSFKAKARNVIGVETGETLAFSTYTLAVASLPLPGTELFGAVGSTSMVVSWSSGTMSGGFNGINATYMLQASTKPNFIPVLSSSFTAGISAVLNGLLPNVTHYFRLRAHNAVGVTDYLWFNLGSTVTAIETPTAVYFDAISSRSITASAYAPGTAFSSMTAGLSGAGVSLGGVYPGLRGESWQTILAMTTARYAFGSVGLGGKFYAVGGNNGTTLGTNEVYDPVSNAWAGKTAMPTVREHLVAGALAGRIYAVGGQAAGSDRAVNESYDPESNSWSAKTSMPTARMGAVGVSAEGKLWVIGGRALGADLGANEAYDPHSDSWSTRQNMTTPRRYLGAAYVSGKIVSVGGIAAGPKLAVNELYDLAGDSWGAGAMMPTAREGPAVAALGGKVYSIGGLGAQFEPANEVYDPAANDWSVRSAMLTARELAGSAVIDGRIQVVGGWNGVSIAVNERYDAGVSSSFTMLTPNTLYSFRAKARNSIGVETAETAVFSTYTLAAATMPQAGTQLFSAVFAASATVNWSSGTPAGGYNGPGATYLVQASSMATFLPVAGSSLTANISATVGGLFVNATHYFRIRAYNAANVTDYSWFVLGSTITAIEAPVNIVFDGISTHSITASAYAATPAFSRMTAGLSGTNIALGGNYQGWHGESWTTKTGMTTARNRLAAGAVGGKLYAVGGLNGGVTLATNEEYDPAANAWAAKAAMPTARVALAAGAVGGKLYAVGGLNVVYLSTNEEYDPAANAWAAKAAMPTAREYLAAGVVGGKLYAVGGHNGVALATNEEYDPATNAWVAKAAMPTVRYGLAAGDVGGKLYAVGGFNGVSLVTNEEYDPAANAWTAKAAMPTARPYLAAEAVGGKLYAVGGNNGVSLATNEEYDPAANAWAAKAAMPTARQFLAAGAVGGKLYAVGGENAVSLATNEVYDPGVASSFTALTPNTLYSFRAKARNLQGVETAETAVVSTYTLATATMPQAGTPLFSAVFPSSITVNWSSGTAAGGFNGPGATYLVQASTKATFLPVAGSSLTANISATVAGLFANATHYFRIRAYNAANVTDYSWFVLGSTLSAIEAPTTVVIDAVSTRSITAAAYAGTPGFSNMSVGLSGSNVAINGAYAGIRGEKWTARAPVTTARHSLAAVTVGGKLYAIGGRNGGTFHAVNEVYDPVSNAWSARAPMPTARQWLAAAVSGGKVYAVGGTDGAVKTANEEYDPAADAWTTKAPLPVAREGLAAVAIGSRVFVLGGNGALTANTEYDPGGNVWMVRAAMPSARAYMAAATAGGKVYAVGGLGAQTANEEYNPATNLWSVREPLPTGRYLMAGAAVGGKVYVIGGTSGVLQTNEEYDPATNQWTARTPMPTARNDHAAVAVGGRIYAVGGFAGGALSANEEFDPGTASSFTALSPNTAYSFTARARNSGGTGTAESAAISTYTLAAATVPQGGAPPFLPVYAASMTVSWSSGTDAGGYNGPGASYLVEASTMAAFAPVAGSSLTFGLSAVIEGLTANATHYVRVRPYNRGGMPDDWFLLGTTVTLANPAMSAASTVTMLGASSMTITWDPNGNSPGTRYEAVFSTYQPFTEAVFVTTSPYGTPSATATGLFANTTYYLAVKVYNRAGAFSGETLLGSTVTHIQSPTTVVIDAVSTHSIVAVASAPFFSSMTVGLSGTNIARDGAYQGWVAGSSVTVSTGLAPNTLYTFRAKARNSVGMETGATPVVSTYTLAFATVPAGGASALAEVFTASVTVNWASGTAAGGYNGPGVSYLVEASTMGTFAPVAGSSATRNPSAVVPGLFVNATHYFRVRAFNTYGAPSEWVVLGATATAIEAPVSVFFDEVSTHSILAAAYVPTPAFTGLSRGLSGTNIALGGAYDPARWHGEKWTAKAAMPTGRHFPAAAVVAGRIHVIGGNEAGNRNENEAYDPVTNTWAARQPLPFGQTELTAVALDGLMYMVGGYANTSAVRSYDPAANGWAARTNLTNNRWLNGTEVLDGKIYTAGGANGFGAGCGGAYTMTSTVEAYDPVTGLWSGRAGLPGARMNPGTAVLGGKMYLFGGCTFDNTTAVYDPVGNAWSTRAAVPIGIGGGRSAVVGGKAYYMGGTVNEEYDPAADAWTQRAGVLTTRNIFALTAFRGRLYAIGGDLSPKTQNEEYDPGTAQYFGGLAPNTLYTFTARARNLHGVETAETAAVSTYTLAAVPAAPAFAGAFLSSVSLQWSADGNPGPTEYRLRASTSPGFTGAGDVLSAWFTGASTQAAALSANTTWYFRVRARNGNLIETADLAFGATVTLAAAPVTAASTYSAVASTSFGLAWLANGNGAGTLYEATASTAVLPNGLPANLAVSTRPSGAPAAPFAGLAPNTTYYAAVRAISHAGLASPSLLLGATVTLAEPPAASTLPFAGVFLTSMTVQWSSGSNPAWTQYRVDAATSADYGGLLWSTDWNAFTSTTVAGLTRNTTYYLRAQARNAAGVPTSFLTLGATATLANVPVDGGNPFPAVFVSSLTASWAGAGNPSWTRYEAVASTVNAVPDGSADEVRVATSDPSAALLAGLVPNATQYLFVRAVNFNSVPSGWAALGTTVTRVEAPTGVYFDLVTTHSVVAVASAPAPTFTNLGIPITAVNIARGGVFQGWVAGSSVTVSSGLTPNTAYAFRAKARNLVGTETPETVDVTTYTLAAVPSTATPSFPAIWLSSLSVAWTSGGNPAPTEYRLETSTASDWSGASDVLSAWASGTATAATGLAVNATYFLRVQARNIYGAETGWRALGSTVTGADKPSPPAGSSFTLVAQTSVTLAWGLGTNPAGTEFAVRASTAAGFTGVDRFSPWLAALTTTLTGLDRDTTYYWRVTARNHSGVESEPRDFGGQATLAAVPSASSEPFHWVGASSANVQWQANGNPGTTLYQASLSTSPAFAGSVLTSGWGAFLSTTVAGLTGDATYYGRVRARGVGGALTDFLTLGSTPTPAGDPPALAAASVGPASLRAEWSSAGNREAESLGAWSVRTALPAAVERHAAALVNGRFYVTGGVRSGAPSAEVWSAGVSPAGTLGAWRREADLPAARESHALAAFGGRLYVVGGFEGSAKTTVYSADLTTAGAVTVWRGEAVLPAGRFKLAVVAHAGWLYALGGDNGVVSQSTVYRTAVDAKGKLVGWAAVASLPAARNSHAAAAAGGRVYVAGGLGAGVEEEVWSAALNGPILGPWTVETPLPAAVFRQALLATGGALVSVGGHDGAAAVAAVRAARLLPGGALGAWESLEPLPAGRFGHGAALETGNILVAGGADDSAAAADAYQAALGGTEYLLERAQDAGFSVDYASSNWRAGAGAESAGLTPNRLYFLRVRVRSRAGAEGALVVSASTRTPAAVPASAASTFSLVEAGSMTLTWASGGNPPGTEFLAMVSTSADFTASLDTSWVAGVSSAVFGLAPNTSYYAGVVARDAGGNSTREVSLGSTVTAAALPEAPSFPSVLTTGLSAAWSTAGNPADTRYEAQLSAAPSFAPLAASTVTVSSGAAFTGLLSATTYHLRVRALNRLGTPSAFTASTQAVTGADFTAPSPVAGLGLHATETPGVLRAAWTAPGDDGGAGVLPPGSKFYLQWAVGGPASVAWSTAAAQLAPSTGPVTPGAGAGILVTGLTAGTSVYARVWAADEAGNVSALSAVASAWASPFTMARLDGAGQDAGRWASVALDRVGDAHAAYTAGTVTQELRYLKRAGGVWSVAEAPDPGIPAEDAVLAMGPGFPQVVYRNSSTGQLRLAKRVSGWSAAAVAAGDLHPGGLAVDATSFAHISYFDAGLPGLRYARWNGAAWDLETVDAGAGRGRFSSLALDGASAPHIAYYDAAAGDLKYASRTAAGVWATSTVDAGVDVGSTPVVALDGAGRPVVVYIDFASRDLKLASFNGASWSFGNIDLPRDVTGVRGLALDGSGLPVVTYYDGTNGDLVFGRFNGSGWETGAVDSYGDVGAWSAVTVESDGGVLELHYDASQGDLKAGSWSAGLAVPLAGNPQGRLQAPASFGGVVASSVGIQWTWTDSASAELGWRLYGGPTSTGPFSVIVGTGVLPATAGTGLQRVYTENGLSEGTTYFRYVAAVSSGGVVVSPMAAVFPYVTADLTAPSVTNNILGGDLSWRRAVGTLYNVDFTDTGGSALDRFQVKASTVAGGAGPDLVAFTDVATGILADTYTADWALPAGVFAALADGATNYITVRVVDGNANVKTEADVFKVLKDTTPPTFADAQADDPVRRGAGGTAYDVDAFDPASGLERFQYSVSTAALSADQGAVPWTDIPLSAGATGFQANWTLAFAGLLGDATNYVSVRAWDRAGSTASLTDAFFVVKDTGGPRVAIQQPAAVFRSVLTQLSGTAADAAGVGGAQVALQESPPGGVWFDGTGFTSGTPVWLAASGTAAWTFGAVPAWADGSAYRVVSRASDTLGNFTVAYATVDFTFDASTPAAAVTVPANGATLVSLPALSGTAADAGAVPSGLALVEVRLQRASDAFYWNWAGAAWSATAASTSAPLASPWTVAVPAALRANLASGASYFVSARPSDNAVPANVGSFAPASTFTWSDTTPPAAVSGLSALTGAAPREILLTWTAPGDDGAVDDIALGTYRIHYSTDPGAVFSSAAAQVEFSTAGLRPGLAQGRTVTDLSSGATYYLRVFLADDAGNWSPVSNGATAYARNQPFNKIVGHVMKSSSQGVTGVLLEAYDASEVRVATASSLPTSSGAYSLNGLPDGVFRVLATWTAGEVTSSVWLDGIPMGTSAVDFMLEIQYTLSTLTGTLASLAAQSAAPAGFLVRAEEGGFSAARVDLLRGGMTVATVGPDPTGRWTIPNLLPGKYAVRAFNGLDFTEPQPVDLGEGETQEVVFVFDPLPEASVFAFPNPARSKTTFRFVSALPGIEAQVTVFDLAGTLVKELPGSAFVAKAGGVYHADWDLTNDDGESVASGVYLFMVKVKGSNGQSGKVVKKLAVVR